MGSAILLPLGAALFYSIGVIFRKLGLNAYPSVLVAGCVASLTAFLAQGGWIGYARTFRQFRLLTPSQRLPLVLSGVFSSIAWLFSFSALKLGPAVVVTPLIFTTPFFTLAISFFFLRTAERVSLRLVMGTALTTWGVYLVCTSA